MINSFLKNRKRVHQLMESNEFIKPLSFYDSEIEILERKKNAKLKCVKVEKVPVCRRDSIPLSWIIDTEVEDSIFTLPQGFKTVDQTIAVFSCTTLYFIMFELKTTLSALDSGLNDTGINKKISDTITKLSVTLPLHVFADSYSEVLDIKYVCLVCYNKDEVSSEIRKSGLENLDLEEEMFREYEKHVDELRVLQGDIERSRRGPREPITITDSTGQLHKVDIVFVKNPQEQGASMNVDLLAEMSYTQDFDYCEHSEFHLPVVP